MGVVELIARALPVLRYLRRVLSMEQNSECVDGSPQPILNDLCLRLPRSLLFPSCITQDYSLQFWARGMSMIGYYSLYHRNT